MEARTERLVIREYAKEDKQNLYKLFTEDFVSTYEAHLQMKSIFDVEKYLEKSINGVGGRVMELEYYLLEEHFNKGYMSEALKEVISLAFGTIGVVKIFAQCHKENVRSENAMIKCGMLKSEKQPNPKMYNGVFKENVRYELTADTYNGV